MDMGGLFGDDDSFGSSVEEETKAATVVKTPITGPVTHKSIVMHQDVSGKFDAGLASLLADAGDFDKLFEQQGSDLKDVLQLAELTDDLVKDLLWTFIGVKLLEEKFAGDRAKWKLVVNKSKKLLVKRLNLADTKAVDSLLTACVVTKFI